MKDESLISCTSLEGEEEVILSPFEYSKILDIQQNILGLMTVEHNQDAIFSRLCLMAEKLLPNSVASIMLVDPATGLMNVISAPSIPPVGHDALKGLQPGPGGGSCGNAVFRNEPQYVRDTKTDNRWSNLRQVAYDFNLCSCWSMPIRNELKEAVGSFALSSFEHRSPSGFHKRLLEICAFIVNIVLKRSDYEKRLKENQAKLEILGTALKNASDGMIVTDENNKIIEVNNSFIDTFGFMEEEVIGKDPNILSSGKHDKSFYANMWNALLLEKHWSGEIINKRANGEFFYEWMSISSIADTHGKVKNYLAVFTDLSEIKENQEKLIQLAYFDQLTQLPNRTKLLLDISQNNPTACAIFNIDRFREINDFFGIEFGDSVLKKLGEQAHQMGLNAYRIGGDEIAVLFYDELSSKVLHSQIITKLAQIQSIDFTVGNQKINIAMSVGVAIGNEKLLTRADIALHSAREKKVSIAFYEENENIEENYKKNIAMTTTIQKAIENGRIICYYQPIVDFRTNTVMKYEALVRMIDEDENLIPPLYFLPIAKRTKLYPQITREVIHKACHCFISKPEEFSVNLSIDDINDPDTVKEIIRVITETKTASRIVFEILESEGIENYASVIQFIKQVKALGAKIAIDDFGTGYSNFEHILNLNVDYIKIDGSLIRGIATNQRHRIVIETIVDFAKKIGAKTIAEFVSDEEIYHVVKGLGVDFSQGYYTGKPQACTS